MEHDFSYNGKLFPVIIERDPLSPEGEEYKATVGGISYGFSYQRLSAHELTLFIDGGASQGSHPRRVFAAVTEDKVLVHIDGHILSFDRTGSDLKTFSRDAIEFGARDHVATPMPGKVVKILVKEGQRVTQKQPLVIVESMKMENEIKSPANGTIKSIHYAPGDLVEPGKPILRIEPDPAV
jgi:pyruvate carboxylase subunit B